jgi:hypothetical protein
MNNGERAKEYLNYLESIGFDYLNPYNDIRDFISQITSDRAEDLLHESVKFLKEINGVPYSYCIVENPGAKERLYYKIRDYAINVVNYFMVEKDYMIKEYKNTVNISDPERYEIEDKVAKEYLNYIHTIDSLDNLSDDGLKRAFLRTFDTIRYFYQTVVAYNDIDKASNESLWEMEKIADMVRNGELVFVSNSKNSISSNNHEDEEQDIIPAAISRSYSGLGVKTKMLISICPEDDKLDQEYNNIHNAFDNHEASYRIIFLLREFLKRLKSIYETKDFITDINLQDYHIIFITGPCHGVQFVKDDFSVITYTNEKR